MVGSQDYTVAMVDDLNVDQKTTSFDSSSVSCSICLDLVMTDNGSNRSRAKLQCGHEFHLDCIGSAFNMKGAMQCPNCRKVEKGQWLYASGSTCSVPEFSMDDWIPDDDSYEISYSEMPSPSSRSITSSEARDEEVRSLREQIESLRGLIESRQEQIDSQNKRFELQNEKFKEFENYMRQQMELIKVMHGNRGAESSSSGNQQATS